MGIGTKLTKLMKEQNTNANELSTKADVPAQTIYSLIRRDASKVDIDSLIKIAHALDVTAEYFCSDEIETSSIINSTEISSSDLKLINKYHDLDSFGQKTVSYILDRETERVASLNKQKERIEELEAAQATIVEFQPHLEANAAHARTDIDSTSED